MNLRSLLQDILSEVSSRIISFQMRLHLLITLVKSSEYLRFIESLRTCIMASHFAVYNYTFVTQVKPSKTSYGTKRKTGLRIDIEEPREKHRNFK